MQGLEFGLKVSTQHLQDLRPNIFFEGGGLQKKKLGVYAFFVLGFVHDIFGA